MVSAVVLVPVLNRPHRVAKLMRSFEKSEAPGEGVHLLFVANESDHGEIQALENEGALVTVVPDDRISWACKINTGFARHVARYEWFVCAADDISFTPGWLQAVKGSMVDGSSGVIGTNHDHSGIVPFGTLHPIVKRDYVEKYGGTFDSTGIVMHEGYRHWCPDTEFAETAMLRNEYVHRPDCILYHRKEPWDSTYAIGQASVKADRRLFLRRMARLFELYGAPERMQRWEHLKPLCDFT